MDRSDDRPGPAARELITLVYEELRRIAHGQSRSLPPDFTLRPTDVVNEACARLLSCDHEEWLSKEHFRAVATRKLWQVALDHLRRRGTAKRGGRRGRTGVEPAQRVPLESVQVEWQDRMIDLLDMAESIETLSAESPRLAQIVQLRWFGGMSLPEVSRALGISVSTTEKDLRYAIAWLSRRLH
jgi:RNA polymerase sigma factor (TIGR02999 family)